LREIENVGKGEDILGRAAAAVQKDHSTGCVF
jgi:hypothetical protein